MLVRSKMRRPEDYVPVKPGAAKPRKSTKPSTASAPRTSELPPPLPPLSTAAAPLAVAEADVDDHHPVVGVPAPPVPAVPRTASLAGKRPPPAASSSSSSGAETLRDSWSEEQFLRRSSGLSSAISSTATGTKPRVTSNGAGGASSSSSSQSQTGQDLEARRRQRQAERDQLAKLGGSGVSAINGGGGRIKAIGT